MAVVAKLRVQNLRPHGDFLVEFAPDVTLITGPNGSGKTSLIEAVYIALQGSSFKGGDGDVLRQDAPWYRIDLTLDDGTVRTVKFEPSRSSGKKQFIVGGKTQYRLLHQHKHPVVLFEPEDLRLLNGSPVRRRQFIDRFISQLDPKYVLALRRYERALRQRNVLLKQEMVKGDDLFVWNVTLSEYGAYIIERRQHFVSELNGRLESAYRGIAGDKDSVSMTYEDDGIIGHQALLDRLHGAAQKDRYLGFTSVGPHRHDIAVTLNGSPALSVASRGEVRTIILALKFLEVAVTEERTGKAPVILLDDVFSELDALRQRAVVQQFKANQTIVASVNAIDARGHIVAL